MSRYRKIDPRIWNDQKFASMSDSGKLLFFMLLTHPSMTALGAMRATLPGLAAEMGWTPEALREAFREAFAKGMAEHDEKACLVALPNFLKYNPPESPNVVKAWVGSVDLLPECHLKTVVLQRLQDYAEGMTQGFAKAFREAFPIPFAKAMPIQEQEQEQEKKDPPKPPKGGKRSKPKMTFPAFIKACHEAGEKPIPPGDPIFKFADDAGIPRDYLLLAWREFAGKHRESGRTQKDWRAHFRDAVRRNWFKLWWFPKDGECDLTTAGVQLKRERDAELAEKDRAA